MQQQRGSGRAFCGGRWCLWRFRWSRGGVVVDARERQRQEQEQKQRHRQKQKKKQIPFGNDRQRGMVVAGVTAAAVLAAAGVAVVVGIGAVVAVSAAVAAVARAHVGDVGGWE